MKIETRDRKGTHSTASLSPSHINAERFSMISSCTDKLNFIGENTNSPKVILRDESEHLSKTLRAYTEKPLLKKILLFLRMIGQVDWTIFLESYQKIHFRNKMVLMYTDDKKLS